MRGLDYPVPDVTVRLLLAQPAQRLTRKPTIGSSAAVGFRLRNCSKNVEIVQSVNRLDAALEGGRVIAARDSLPRFTQCPLGSPRIELER